METTHVVGQTRSVGFNFGIRKTFNRSVHALWDFVFSPEGLACWLGKHSGALRAAGTYSAEHGKQLKIRVWKDYSHVRMDYSEKDWDNTGLLQVRILAGKDENHAVLSFHLEKLKDAQQREAVRQRFETAMERVAVALQ